uniref:Multigene family 300 protein n=1 Tax=African swine fever virus TaxID=10497 RepID=Q65131_ASF|nr:multigene family 300 protein [African swine fever virus]
MITLYEAAIKTLITHRKQILKHPDSRDILLALGLYWDKTHILVKCRECGKMSLTGKHSTKCININCILILAIKKKNKRMVDTLIRMGADVTYIHLLKNKIKLSYNQLSMLKSNSQISLKELHAICYLLYGRLPKKIKQGMQLCKTMAGLCGELLCAFLAP